MRARLEGGRTQGAASLWTGASLTGEGDSACGGSLMDRGAACPPSTMLAAQGKERALLSPQHCRVGPESPIRRLRGRQHGPGEAPHRGGSCAGPGIPILSAGERAESWTRGGTSAGSTCDQGSRAALERTTGLSCLSGRSNSRQAAGLIPGPVSLSPGGGLKQDTQLGAAPIYPTTRAGARLGLTETGADEANEPARGEFCRDGAD